MTQDEFIQTVQSQSARIAVGASTVRGRGNAGAVASSRILLRHLNLAPLGVRDRATFEAELNRTTDALCAALPRNCQHWGMARKILNIFLRDCFYTSYLVSAFDLERAEHFSSCRLIRLRRHNCETPPGEAAYHLGQVGNI